MNSYYKQAGGGEARIEAREALELDRLDNMTENELYDELLSKYQNYYGDRGKAIERLNKMENRGKDGYIKEILEFNTLYNRARRFLGAGARKKKKPKGSKKKGHSKKGSKGSKKKAKKQGGGKSRKPKKAKHSRKKKKSRSRGPRRMRTRRQKRAGAGDNPYPLMFSRNDAYGK